MVIPFSILILFSSINLTHSQLSDSRSYTLYYIMTIKDFEIVFEKSKNGSYYLVGETLVGKVIISTEEGKRNEENLKKLQINFTGKARNSWFEERPNKKLVEILEEEEYLSFEAEVILDGKSQSKRSEFGFEYELTDGLPPSFKGTYGSIIYAVSATLFKQQDSLEATQTITKEFVVKAHVDLNAFPQASQSAEVKLSQALLFENGSLGMEANIYKSGYVPGEVINFHSKFVNESNKDVNVSLQLIQETIFHAKDRQVSDIAVIASIPGPILKPHSMEVWNGDMLKVPSLPPSVLENCDIISIQYRLGIEMEVPDPNINLEGSIPIIIGTRKIEKKVDMQNGDQSRSNNETITIGSDLAIGDQAKSSEPAKPGLRKYRSRQNRPQTTCLVFRKDRPRQKLPTPQPESWAKPTFPTGVQKPTITEILNDNAHEINTDDLSNELAEVLTLRTDGDKGEPCFAPVFPGNTEAEKPKFPEKYIRRGEKKKPPRPHEPTAPNLSSNVPPRKPERRITKSDSKSDIPSFPGDVPANITACNDGIIRQSVEAGPPSYKESCGKDKAKARNLNQPAGNSKKATLPYPKESNIAYPLPDYSFNVFLDGQKREAIGWNITRNTLSLKRAKVAAGFVLPLPTVGWSADPPDSSE